MGVAMKPTWYSIYRDVYENTHIRYYVSRETAYNGYLLLFSDTTVQWAVLYYNRHVIDRCTFWQGDSYEDTPLSLIA